MYNINKALRKNEEQVKTCREISVGARNQFGALRPLSSVGESVRFKPYRMTALKSFEWQNNIILQCGWNRGMLYL